MYRAVALMAIREGIAFDDAQALTDLTKRTDIRLESEGDTYKAVSYTHLDVYKRQPLLLIPSSHDKKYAPSANYRKGDISMNLNRFASIKRFLHSGGL